MKEQKEIRPPRWAEYFLSSYCKPELLEDLQGDLNEYFERNLKSKGVRKAKLIYVIDVLKFFRLYTVRKPEFVNVLINWLMIGSYIKTSRRNIVRNKLFSTINIVGLSISMSVGLMMIGMLSDIFSYDKFHVNHDRIYRVISNYQYLKNENQGFNATASLKSAKTIKETFVGVEDVAIFHREFSGDVNTGDKTIPLQGFWSNESLFNVFSFELIHGNPATALKEPFSVVLTEQSAKKLFGNDDPLNKSVMLNKKQYAVTGILKDLPAFSHVKFDMLGSLSTREIVAKDIKKEIAWDQVWNDWVYILLPADADLKTFKANLDRLSQKEDATVENTHIELALQPLDNIMVDDVLNNEIGPVFGQTTLWFFLGVSAAVILSACFNYTNLSIARALRRAREVGIRKVIGALKIHVVAQFVVEAIIISFCSFLIALALFLFLRMQLFGLHPMMHEVFALNLSSTTLFYFIGFAIAVGILAGLLPAIFFSRINAIQVLKGLSVGQSLKKLNLRKTLIVFQYSISIIFITFTMIIFKQYNHFVNFDLGCNTKGILNVPLLNNKTELLKKELDELSEIKNISQSSLVTGVGDYWSTRIKYKNPTDSAVAYYNIVDENYIPLHEIKLLSGKNFTARADSSIENEVIVNQQVLKRFNIAGQDPAMAIGETITVGKKQLQIIAVTRDYQYGRSNNTIKQEVVLRYANKGAQWLNVKIQSEDLIGTYAKIESIWKKHDRVHPFEAKFYDDQITEAFSGMKTMVTVAGFLAFLAICIASMGLLGMVVFTTETRLREISIRKVLGATEMKLVYLLGKGFLLLLVIATGIALPITFLFFDRVLLPMLINHAPLSWLDLFAGTSVVILLALIMIASQTLKIARANPAEVLKAE